MQKLDTTDKPRTGGLKELLIVYFLAFLLLLAILWYVDSTTGLVLQFTLNCNSLLPIGTTGGLGPLLFLAILFFFVDRYLRKWRKIVRCKDCKREISAFDVSSDLCNVCINLKCNQVRREAGR